MTPEVARSSSRPVVVVGDVGIDVLTRPRLPLARLVEGGEAPSSVRLTPGGAGGNTASWLARHAVPVALVARVGDDQAGLSARTSLEGNGVRCVFAVDETLPTCVVVVIVDASGERTMLSDRGANAAFSVADVDLDSAQRALGAEGTTAHLHLSGYVLFSPTSCAAGLAALAEARRRGWTTSVDPQAAELVAEVGADEFLRWVEGVDLLLPNEIEVDALGGPSRVLEHVGHVAVTYGAAGARWFSRDGASVHVTAPVVTCLDSTGCGDAFNAGLLGAWLADATPYDALLAGVRAGSTAAVDLGARPT